MMIADKKKKLKKEGKCTKVEEDEPVCESHRLNYPHYFKVYSQRNYLIFFFSRVNINMLFTS